MHSLRVRLKRPLDRLEIIRQNLTSLRRISTLLAVGALALALPQKLPAAYAALYGSDGNDFYTFTGDQSVSNMKNSGWNGLIMFAISVQPNGDIDYEQKAIVTNGSYVGSSAWGSNVTAVKTAPTTVYRYEVCVGGYNNGSFDNIKSLIASQGTGTGSILYKNFKALKNAVPGIDAINDDDEKTYDLNSSVSFAQMLSGMGMKFTLAPYQNQSFWVSLKNSLGNICDMVYLQCYQGGDGNDPGNWDSAFGGFHVFPGLESNYPSESQFSTWQHDDVIVGGFYWPDVSWSPSVSWGVPDILNGVSVHSNTYSLRVRHSGQALDPDKAATANLTPLIQYPYDGTTTMQWALSFLNDGTSHAKLIGVASGRSVDVTSNSMDDNAVIELYDYRDTNNQLVTLTSNGLGYYTPIFVSSGKAMTVQDASTAPAAAIIQYTYNDGTNAQWLFCYP